MAASPKTSIVTADPRRDDPDTTLRPLTLAEFVGQRAARKNLSVFIEAARSRQDRKSVV